jgi:hypothetical protein
MDGWMDGWMDKLRLKRREVTGGCKNLIARGFIRCTPHHGNKYNGMKSRKMR